MNIIFNSCTDTLHYPDGVEEKIEDYLSRKEKFEALRDMQQELERLKVLYQNPGCSSAEEIKKTKEEVRGSILSLWYKVF